MGKVGLTLTVRQVRKSGRNDADGETGIQKTILLGGGGVTDADGQGGRVSGELEVTYWGEGLDDLVEGSQVSLELADIADEAEGQNPSIIAEQNKVRAAAGIDPIVPEAPKAKSGGSKSRSSRSRPRKAARKSTSRKSTSGSRTAGHTADEKAGVVAANK
jgi:hypothetical protein